MLQSIVNSVKSNKFNELVYATHLLDKINYQRVASRVRQTVENPETPMKVVLFEYDYTKLCDVQKGVVAGRLETIPGTGVHVQYVVHTEAFKDLMQALFCTNSGFAWFHRNRWEKNGKPNLTRRQVVLAYTPQLIQQVHEVTQVPEVRPVEQVAQVESIRPPRTAISEDAWADMPQLLNYNSGLPGQIPSAPMLNTTVYNPNNWSFQGRASSALGY
jgi:hypothetical protein